MSETPRYLALGDSYTIGEGLRPGACWPAQLVSALHQRGTALAPAQIVATTGWTTDELAAGIRNAELAPPYALVSLLIGVNNQYRGRPVEDYADQFRTLLARAIALAGDRPSGVVVVSIPDWGVTRFAAQGERDAPAIGRAIDAFNAQARADAAAAGTVFVDITDLTRQYPDELVADGLHPSAEQYARWVARIAPVALAALG